MPNVLCLTPCGATHPSVRLRLFPFIEEAKARGGDIQWLQCPDAALKRLAFCARLPRVRTIVLHRMLPSSMELRVLRSRCQRLVVDLDEALWTAHPSQGDIAPKQADRRLRRLLKTCAAAQLVIAGTPFLAETVEGVSSSCLMLPTPVDTSVYVPPAQRKRRGRPVVGWMGTTRNQYTLPDLFTDLTPAAPLVRVLVVSGEEYVPPEEFDGDFAPWSEEREVELLQSMDIGLMPMPNSEYTRGKCPVRLMQYMACGVVPVASDVGFNRDVITHGRDGFLAQTPDDFAEFVGLLARENDLRSEMAQRAREKVQRRFDTAIASRELWHAMDNL
ncbi:glycosyltransferase family 4 protein [Desulfobaculum sp. SPO524]|uniref:glycosyltransferase family 4 protein n=1 Tax=Desulfobaculum sp. SPO524 TaxID=3378071 RepID=UPI0038537754